MEQNKKSIDGIIEKLALIADASNNLFPNGKMCIVFELEKNDFKKVQGNFRGMDQEFKQFKIDISGTEFIFLLNELSNSETNKT
jgi:hypothetical protein